MSFTYLRFAASLQIMENPVMRGSLCLGTVVTTPALSGQSTSFNHMLIAPPTVPQVYL